MSDAVWIALSGAVVAILISVVLPIVMANLTNAATARALEVANTRTDRIAADVKRDTEAVRVQAENAAALLVESNTSRAAQAKRTDAKLQDMHVLINSLYTAAKEGELRAVELTLTTLRALHRQGPTAEVAAQIETTEADRNRLRSELDERALAAKFAAERHEV
jgi:uncharacterized membrane protein YccC